MDVEEDLIYNLKKAATLRRFLTENEEQFFSKTVGEVIKESLESKKLTKAKVAERAGTSWVYLYQILTGKRNPSRNRILAIRLAMGCDLREMQALLHDCGFAELDERRRRDAIIIFGILHGKGVNDIDFDLIRPAIRVQLYRCLMRTFFS